MELNGFTRGGCWLDLRKRSLNAMLHNKNKIVERIIQIKNEALEIHCHSVNGIFTPFLNLSSRLKCLQKASRTISFYLCNSKEDFSIHVGRKMFRIT